MRLEDTHNIHRNINCIFPWFKLKRLCEKGIHNYGIKRNEVQFSLRQIEGNVYQLDMMDSQDKLVCLCCGKEEHWETDNIFLKAFQNTLNKLDSELINGLANEEPIGLMADINKEDICQER